ncbi:MAG: selenium-binding family protein [Isosphaeraceae bacterium]
MRRRDFLKVPAGGALASLAAARPGFGRANDQPHHPAAESCHLTYASPKEAMASPRETLAYVTCTSMNMGTDRPDVLATVDLDPSSKTYSQVIHRAPMPASGDELHHFGWNACSSCHGDPSTSRRYLIVPGLKSSKIHILDTIDPKAPKLHKVIEADAVKKTGLSSPHTVHCLPDGRVLISMLGDADGNAPGGFLLLDANFEVVGPWASSLKGMRFNYDFWYQPRHNVMVSSEWGAPNTVARGFQLGDVAAGRFGRRLQFWDWTERRIAQTLDLGDDGRIPLEVRFHHDPASTHGFIGTALGSTVWHWWKEDKGWTVEKVITVDPVEVKGWPMPMPGLITDNVLSMDDRFLYFSNWLQGDLRQYDVSNPSKPKLTGRVWLGGILGRSGPGEGDPSKPATVRGHKLQGGPQMLQLSLDGKRLYVTNSLFSPWDNQFYPEIGKSGSHMVQLDCDTERGGMSINDDFFVDFGTEPDGPIRAHEVRFPNGDSTSDIWV